MVIKDYIKEELIKLIINEEDLLMKRKANMDNDSSISEVYQIKCEEKFINKLKEFVYTL